MRIALISLLLTFCSACSTSASQMTPAILPEQVAYTSPLIVGADETEVAQTFDHPSLTVQQAVEIAIGKSPAIKSINFRLKAQGERLEVADHFPDPHLGLKVEEIAISNSTSEDVLLLGITQEVPLGGTLDAQRAIAEENYRNLQLRHKKLINEVKAEVRGAFYSALVLQNSVELQAQLIEIVINEISLLQSMQDGGEITAEPIWQSHVENAKLQQELLRLTQAKRHAHFELSALLGIRNEERKLEGELDASIEVPQLSGILANLEASPTVGGISSIANSAQLKANLASASNFPRVTLELFYRNSIEDSIDAGLFFELPFSGLRESKKRAAQLEAYAAQSEAQLYIRQTQATISQIHSSLSQTIAELKIVDEQRIPANVAQVLIAQSLFEAGATSMFEYLESKKSLIKARQARLKLWLQAAIQFEALSPFLL